MCNFKKFIIHLVFLKKLLRICFPKGGCTRKKRKICVALVPTRRAGKRRPRMTVVQPEDVRLSSQGKEQQQQQQMCKIVSYNGELERIGNMIKKNNARKTKSI